MDLIDLDLRAGNSVIRYHFTIYCQAMFVNDHVSCPAIQTLQGRHHTSVTPLNDQAGRLGTEEKTS